MSSVRDAIAAGELPGRVWFYANYHCNLACTYCFT
jgi:sulfatase maturation enzyme AslB (radical SAM superfamily)